ncbi:unnamed protein product [Rotaria sordida]|nr:unnamed protein product [Rotaria sordida]
MPSIQPIVLIFFISSIAVQGQYKFSNCGSNPSNHHIQLKDLQIIPHPFKVPGPVLFRLNIDVSEDIVHPLQTAFDLKATAFLITVPIKCEDGVGSCTYPDWCVACSTCSCPVLAGYQLIEIPMNFTASIPIGSKATVTAQIEFRSDTGQTDMASPTDPKDLSKLRSVAPINNDPNASPATIWDKRKYNFSILVEISKNRPICETLCLKEALIFGK